MHQFYESPRCAEVHNLGGGKDNSCSILEPMDLVERFSGRRSRSRHVDQNRIGDHICYYSDLRKMKTHYPSWSVSKSLPEIVSEITRSWQRRLAATATP
jgi:CDP-paratose 2-epimerase